jgi:hypothetical protein
LQSTGALSSIPETKTTQIYLRVSMSFPQQTRDVQAALDQQYKAAINPVNLCAAEKHGLHSIIRGGANRALNFMSQVGDGSAERTQFMTAARR